MASGVQQRERAAMTAVTGRLVKDFAADHGTAEITEVISAAYQRYEQAPIRDFVPILVERQVRHELRETS